MRLSQHPKVKNITVEFEFEPDGSQTTIYAVFADMPLSQLEAGFDPAAFEELVNTARLDLDGLVSTRISIRRA